MLLEVFVATAKPYCDALHAWLHHGVLADPHQEFCVLPGECRVCIC